MRTMVTYIPYIGYQNFTRIIKRKVYFLFFYLNKRTFYNYDKFGCLQSNMEYNDIMTKYIHVVKCGY